MYQSRSFSFNDLIEDTAEEEPSANREGINAEEMTTNHTVISNNSQTSSMPPDNTCYPEAKKIRLESTTGQQISMFELIAQHMGANVALQGTANQSSDRNNGEILDASRAIDGDNTTYSHTNGSNPIWEVDLDQSHQIDSVLIVNRYCGNNSTDDPLNCFCRLSNSTLALIDESDEVLTIESLGNTCSQSIIYKTFGKEYPCPIISVNVDAHNISSSTQMNVSLDNTTTNVPNQTDDLEFDLGVDLFFTLALVFSGSRWFGTLEFGLGKDFKLDKSSCK